VSHCTQTTSKQRARLPSPQRCARFDRNLVKLATRDEHRLEKCKSVNKKLQTRLDLHSAQTQQHVTINEYVIEQKHIEVS
jgi:hypothetical protein